LSRKACSPGLYPRKIFEGLNSADWAQIEDLIAASFPPEQAYLKASNTGTLDEFGYSVAIFGDTVVVGAYREDSNATGVNNDGSNNLSADLWRGLCFCARCRRLEPASLPEGRDQRRG
jgi:hypothetical protein